MPATVAAETGKPREAQNLFDPTHYERRIPLENCAVVDLFCGVGGLTYGLRSAGIHVVAGIDVDSECRYPFEKNNGSKFIEKNVSLLTGKELNRYYPEGHLKVLVGCAPCQDFSKYSRVKKAAKSDRWSLLRSFARLVRELRPDVISMENVPEIEGHSILSEFIGTLDEMEYHKSSGTVHCPKYGVPQSRDRFVLFASKLGPISLIPPLLEPPDYPTVANVIRTMEHLNAGGASSKDPLHRSSKLSSLNLERIRASKPGGTWRDWEKYLRSPCHQKDSGETFPSVYGRMEWDKLSPTITTQYFGYGNGRFGHPEQDRAISLREGSLLQSFPRDYEFIEPEERLVIDTIGRMVGNAVPPRLGEAVGLTIRKHVERWRLERMLPASSEEKTYA